MMAIDPDADLYELLQVSPTADPDVIAAAWRRLAARYHPDGPEPDEDRFKLLERAYSILSDPAARASYDLDRRLSAETARGADSATTTAAPAPAVPVPYATAPGAGGSGGHGWWATWLRIEGRMARLLATAPWGVSVVTAAVAGGTLGYVGSGLATLPPPAEIWQLGVIGFGAWLAGGMGWVVHRRHSVATWAIAVRLYTLAMIVLLTLAAAHAIAQLLGVLLLVAVVAAVLRHRAHRRTVGAPR